MNWRSLVDVCRRERPTQTHDKCSPTTHMEQTKNQVFWEFAPNPNPKFRFKLLWNQSVACFRSAPTTQPIFLWRQSRAYTVYHPTESIRCVRAVSYIITIRLFVSLKNESCDSRMERLRFVCAWKNGKILLGKMMQTMTVIMDKNLKTNLNFSFTSYVNPKRDTMRNRGANDLK